MTEGEIRSKRCFWVGVAPLVLASKSESRRALLTAAGLHAEILPANIALAVLKERNSVVELDPSA